MSVLTVIVGIILIAFALYLVQTYVNAPWKTPALLVIVLLALIWIASFFVPGLTTARVP